MMLANPYLWVVEYLSEVEADFLAFFHIFDILDEPKLDGPRFLRLATELPRYQGAVRNRLEYEVQHQEDSVTSSPDADNFRAGESMSMGEALARAKGNDMAVLDSLNRDSQNSALGALFEYETG